MNEEQLLKEIAFYSRFIKQHMDHENSQFHVNKKVFVNPYINTVNKFKYVKTATTPAVIKPVQKVLINPNFKHPNVHINPHFNSARKILVNPKVLNQQLSIISTKCVASIKLNPAINISKNLNNIPTNLTPRKRRLSVRSQYKIVKSSIKSPDQCIISSNTKVTKLIPSIKNTNDILNSYFPNLTERKRRLSIRSKYKIVKSSSSAQLKSPLKRRASILSKYKIIKSSSESNKLSSTKNKYKIDRRSITVSNKSFLKRKVISYGISDLLRKNLFKSNNCKNKLVINQFKANNTRLTNISGILYKKTQTKLQKIHPKQKTPKLQKMYSPNKILRRSVTKTPDKLMENITRKLKFKEQQRYNLQKNNIPCPVYRRYGKCRRKEAERCRFLHNPDQIFLCKKFLQGACVEIDCLLSHQISLEKMPTCKYFLEGCCTKNDCPYLHVKINPKANICRKFLQGFCDKGSQCNLRHQFLCPNFERDGKCPKRKCIYPHKNKCDTKSKDSVETKEKVNKNIEKQEAIVRTEPAQIESASRYYIDSKLENNLETEQKQVKYCYDNEIIDDLSTDNKIYKRPQLGELPCFIPLN